MTEAELYSELKKYEKLLIKADADSKRACAARGSLPLGASRARMTTLNARWMAAAERRDRIADRVDEIKETMAKRNMCCSSEFCGHPHPNAALTKAVLALAKAEGK